MDFAQLKPQETAVVQLKHPVTGKVIDGATVEVYGSESKAFRRMMHDIRKQALKRATVDELSFEDDLAAQIKRMAELTVCISGIEENGKPVTDAVHLYTEYNWAFQQVNIAVMRLENFMPATEKR